MRWIASLIAAFGLLSSPAEACSVAASYKIPTNFELVQQAKMIVLARVKDVPSDAEAAMLGRGEGAWVTLEPVRFLKGSAPADRLRLMGWRPPGKARGIPTPTTLSQAHWSTGIGGCIRQFYEPGELVVAMFGDDPEAKKLAGAGLVQLFEPFARIVETVDGPEDLWVHAVERYVSLQSGPAEKLNERIDAVIAKLNTTTTIEAEAIAADLQYYLTRKEPSDAWGAVLMPLSASANTPGRGGAGIFCLPGSPAAVIIDSSPAKEIELTVTGRSFVAKPATPTEVEAMALDSPFDQMVTEGIKRKPSLYRFADPAGLFSVLRSATGRVEIAADGKPIAGGKPLDAFLRWTSHCEKLSSMPPLTKKEMQPQ